MLVLVEGPTCAGKSEWISSFLRLNPTFTLYDRHFDRDDIYERHGNWKFGVFVATATLARHLDLVLDRGHLSEYFFDGVRHSNAQYHLGCFRANDRMFAECGILVFIDADDSILNARIRLRQRKPTLAYSFALEREILRQLFENETEMIKLRNPDYTMRVGRWRSRLSL